MAEADEGAFISPADEAAAKVPVFLQRPFMGGDLGAIGVAPARPLRGVVPPLRMRIKKIEASGFKSFADKQTVHVDDHVTAVIGPNGCGKSNIVDAVRWCLGEQRAKHLRGAGMSDVIFSGSATRGPSGSAEVTITFENEGKSSASHLSFQEIAVTRRLYRDGTSEYCINRAQCRLRDIADLLSGTGVGTRGYSVIEQGRVSDLVVSKPETRRQVIEEAAGVTKFKAQKATAERRIDQTRQNLLRVTDVINELEARLGTLQRQAQKAERYKRYREELRDLELWMASHKFLEFGALEQVLAVRESDLRERVEAARQALESADAASERTKSEVGEREEALEVAQKSLFDVENRIQLNRQDHQFRGKERASAQSAASTAERDCAASRGQLEQLTLEAKELSEQLEKLGSRSGDQSESDRASELQLELDAKVDAYRDARERLDELRSEYSATETKIASARARVQSREEAGVDLRERLDRCQSQLEATASDEKDEGQRLAFVAELESATEQVEARLQAVKRAESTRAERLEALKKIEASFEAASAEVIDVRTRLASLIDMQSRHEACSSAVRALAAESDEGAPDDAPPVRASGILGQRVRTEERFEAALSAYCGERLQSVVLENDDEIRTVLDWLRARDDGRVSLLARDPADSAEPRKVEAAALATGILGPLRNFVEFQPDIRSIGDRLLGECIVAETLDAAFEYRARAETPVDIVTLAGDVVHASGLVVGGALGALDSTILARRREIEELEQRVAGAEQRHGEQREAVEELRHRLETEQRARGRIDGALLESQQARLEAKGRIDAFDADRSRARSVREGLESDRERLLAADERRRDELDAMVKQLAELEAVLPQVAESVEAAREALGECETARDSAAERATQAKVALARWQQQRDGLIAALERIDRQVRQEEARAEKLEQDAQSNSEAALALESTLAELESEHAVLIERQQIADASTRAAREEHDALKLRLDELSLEVRRARSEYEELREKLGEVEVGLRELAMDRELIVTSVAERFEAELDLLVVDFHDRELADGDTKTRAEELKRVLSRMGEVNLTAITEYEEVVERYEYLTSQRSDLEGAIAQLQEAIDKINETTQERFDATFKAVNEKFQALFPRLFAGGRAELVLTNPNDLLTTGVEIMAQPPGKKVSSLELLSGGEKALTAVSLIFGIFLIKPSPFCLLDEVDAPLDEANVGRFCDLISELAEETQFIIITHNKRSMEIADRLYGVTMQSRGVSKLVSVNISKAVGEARFEAAPA